MTEENDPAISVPELDEATSLSPEDLLIISSKSTGSDDYDESLKIKIDNIFSQINQKPSSVTFSLIIEGFNENGERFTYNEEYPIDSPQAIIPSQVIPNGFEFDYWIVVGPFNILNPEDFNLKLNEDQQVHLTGDLIIAAVIKESEAIPNYKLTIEGYKSNGAPQTTVTFHNPNDAEVTINTQPIPENHTFDRWEFLTDINIKNYDPNVFLTNQNSDKNIELTGDLSLRFVVFKNPAEVPPEREPPAGRDYAGELHSASNIKLYFSGTTLGPNPVNADFSAGATSGTNIGSGTVFLKTVQGEGLAQWLINANGDLRLYTQGTQVMGYSYGSFDVTWKNWLDSYINGTTDSNSTAWGPSSVFTSTYSNQTVRMVAPSPQG